MIDPNKVTEAVMEFMKNPIWKDIFTNAPGGAMERLAISFYFSKFHDQFKPEDFDEYRSLRDEYEKSMTEEDLQYLIDNSDKDTAIKHYTELLDKLRQSGGKPTGNLRFEKDENGGQQQDGANVQMSEQQVEQEQQPPPEQDEQQDNNQMNPSEEKKPEEEKQNMQA